MSHSRKSEAEKIQVRLPDEQGSTPEPPTGQPHSRPAQPADAPSASRPPHAGGCPHCGTHSQHLTTDSPKADGTITIALVGNPNCGKTSLFNAASGGHERTGNYSGVTVSSVVGEMVFEGRRIRLVDLPGTYSLRAFSPEEAYVAHELESGRIDAVINVLDTTNLERNLLLTLQLKERNVPLVGALNMFDEFEESRSTLDIEALSRRLDMPLFPTVARNRVGIADLLREAVKVADRHIALHRSGVEGHNHEAACCHDPEHCTHCTEEKAHAGHAGPTPGSAEACPCPEREQEDAERYAHIGQILDGIYGRKKGRKYDITAALDRLLARRWLAYPAFVAILWFIFWMTFTIGQYPMDWIDAGVAWLTAACEAHIPEGTLQALLCDGVLGGVGSVIVFLPNILILYFFISILEDSGYLARAAMLADPLFDRLGLHGKSFIPMLMGFGCNVPAVMATRTIENPKSRMLTMLVTPMVSCSARIPVYVVFAGAFFPQNASTVMLLPLRLRHGHGLVRGLGVQQGLHAEIRQPLRDGAPALPPAQLARRVPPHLGERAPVPAQDGRHHPGGQHRHLGLGLLPHHERRTDGSRTAGTVVHGTNRPRHGTGAPPLGIRLAHGRGHRRGRRGKGTDGQHPRSALQLRGGRCRGGNHGRRRANPPGTGTDPAHHARGSLGLHGVCPALLPCLATIAAVKGESGSWKWAIFTATYTTLLAYAMAFAVYRVALLF